MIEINGEKKSSTSINTNKIHANLIKETPLNKTGFNDQLARFGSKKGSINKYLFSQIIIFLKRLSVYLSSFSIFYFRIIYI